MNHSGVRLLADSSKRTIVIFNVMLCHFCHCIYCVQVEFSRLERLPNLPKLARAKAVFAFARIPEYHTNNPPSALAKYQTRHS